MTSPHEPDPNTGDAAPAEVADEAAEDDVAATESVPASEDAEAAGDADAADPLAVALRERDDYLDALQRKQADFENFRKRMMREGATQRIAGHAEVAERLLDVLDDFDRTLANATDVDPGFLKGVQLVHDKLVSILRDFGLTRIADAPVPFDPTRHEAVQQVASDDDLDEPRVTEVLRPGYELGGRVLRAAMVVVEQ